MCVHCAWGSGFIYRTHFALIAEWKKAFLVGKNPRASSGGTSFLTNCRPLCSSKHAVADKDMILVSWCWRTSSRNGQVIQTRSAGVEGRYQTSTNSRRLVLQTWWVLNWIWSAAIPTPILRGSPDFVPDFIRRNHLSIYWNNANVITSHRLRFLSLTDTEASLRAVLLLPANTIES